VTPYVCTNCGFWQRRPATPTACPVCDDFRHTPPEDGFTFLPEGEAARAARTSWVETENGAGIVAFSSEPRWGIGPRGYLIPHPDGNIFFEGTGWYDAGALDRIAARGGVRWLAASHPHAYGALWQVQERFRPEVVIGTEDLAWTNAFAATWPFDDRLALAPGVTLIHTGGHFAGHSILHLAGPGILFAGDMVKFHSEGGRVVGISTHKGFNRRIPMSHAEIRRYQAALEGLEFGTVYTTFERAACTPAQVSRLFDAQLASRPFFGPVPMGEAA
jgi:hypothetical protein